MDGTSRLSRDGERVYHYCFLSTFAEACVVPERSCVRIPDDVPFDVAALVGCAVTTGVGAVWRTAGVRPGDRVAVIGCGGVGLSALMAAVAVGAEPVIAVDMTQTKVDAAKAFGASAGVVWAGSAEATAEAVREVSGGGVDYAIEATGHGEAMQAAVLSTRNRGAAVLIGIPREDTMLSVPARTIPRMERRILGSIYGSARPERDFLTTLDVYRSGRLPLDRLVSHRLPLADVNEAIDLMLSGEALRVVLDTTDGRSVMNIAELDGRIGEGWGGLSPNGCHVNVVLAHRGSPTAAAAISMFAHPSPGHSPVLCCVGEAQTSYEPIWPPTLMMNKTTATTPEIETMTWGAGQLGIGKAVLDSVAAGLIEASGDLIVLVAIWLDGRADDETAVLQAARTAVGKAIRMCVEGRDPEPPRRSWPSGTRSRTRSTAATEAGRACRLQPAPHAVQATSVIASAPASWQSRQRASYESSAPTTIVSPEYGAGLPSTSRWVVVAVPPQR